jgi:hypothetical protein
MKMQIKTTMKYHFIAIKTATIKIKNLKIVSVGNDVKKLEFLCTVGGNMK